MPRLILDLLEVILFSIIFIILKLLGKKFSSALCAFLFLKIGPLTKFNKIAKKNILFVWPKKSTKAIKIILDGMWQNMGRNFGELVHLKNYQPFFCNNTKIMGLHIIRKIISENKKKNKGIIFFSAHYGNWELGPIIIKNLNLKPLSIYRKSNNKFLDFLIQYIRSSYGNYAPKGDLGAKKAFIWLRNGKSLALLMDQKLNEGPPIKFLGKPAATASFIAELAIRMDLDIVPIKFSRNNQFKSIITFQEKIIMPEKDLDNKAKIKIILTQVNNIISDWITNEPEFWLWIHRRWSKRLYL